MAFVKGDCSRRGLLGRGRGDRGSEARRGEAWGVARRPIWEWESEECGGAKFELSFVSVESSRVKSSVG